VSAVTVHRDLERLASEGLVERVHGGARALGGAGGSVIATAWSQRTQQAADAKTAIAAHAARYVESGTTVFLDASSTALALAHELMDRPPNEVTLVTNSPAIAFLMQAESVHVVVTPGELDQHMRMVGGRWTVEFLSQLHFDLAFISAAGVTLEKGLTTSRRPLADVINAARATAERTIGLIDATKFARNSLLTIVHPHELDAVIVDPALPEEVAADYRAAGVRLEISMKEEDDE
jgi:DeoR family fructose operon transcriptional repressor